MEVISKPNKKIETRIWIIKELYEIFKNNNFKKPKFQRKMRWTKRPTGNTKKASFKEYIDFLMKYENSQIPIALGKRDLQNHYTVCDGNNRIHAIIYFLERPYSLFSEWYSDIIRHIEEEECFKNIEDELINEIKAMKYDHICNYTLDDLVDNCFTQNIKDVFNELPLNIVRKIRDKFKNLKKKFLFGREKKFDAEQSIKLVVNIFYNYTYRELSDNYKEVHAKLQQMDEFDLLAASLGSVTNFTIKDNVLNLKLINVIVEYYENRSRDDELLTQYKIKSDEDFEWSAFDFLLAFQEHLAIEFGVINKLDFSKSMKDKIHLPFIFKLYNIVMCNTKGLGENYFNTDNINLFIDKCIEATKCLKDIIDDMYPMLADKENITGKIARRWHGTSCVILLCLCMKVSQTTNISEKKQKIKQIKIIMHYHLFLKQIKIPQKSPEKETLETEKKGFRIIDVLDVVRQEVRTDQLEYCNSTYSNPDKFLNKAPSKEELGNIIKYINESEIKRNSITPSKSDDTGKKRKKVSLINYALMTDYSFSNLPNKYIEKIKQDGVCLHNDHIVPFSTRLNKDAGDATFDRLGNLCPIISTLNIKRGNGHISLLYEDKDASDMLTYLNIYPSKQDYDSMVHYEKRGSNNVPILKNNKLYDDFCKITEEKYISSFLRRLYE